MYTEATTGGVWYFAHPYTAKDKQGNYVPEAEEANFNICNYRAAELLKRGYNIYAPISHTHPIHRACPEFLKMHEHDIWYKLDNEVIDRMDWAGIILAPGWEQSNGCCAEMTRIKNRDLPVLLYVDIIQEVVTYVSD